MINTMHMHERGGRVHRFLKFFSRHPTPRWHRDLQRPRRGPAHRSQTESRQHPAHLWRRRPVGDCRDEFKLDFSGVAQSLVFAAKTGNIGFDDLTISLYTPAANVPEPAALGTFGLGGVVDRLVRGAASALRPTVSGQARAALRQPSPTGLFFERTPSWCASQPGVLCSTPRSRGVLPQRRLETPRAVGAGLAGERRFSVPVVPVAREARFYKERTPGATPEATWRDRWRRIRRV